MRKVCDCWIQDEAEDSCFVMMHRAFGLLEVEIRPSWSLERTSRIRIRAGILAKSTHLCFSQPVEGVVSLERVA